MEGLAGGCDELSDEDMRRLGITPQPFSALEPIGSNRLSWAPSICCSADDLNAHTELVNLSNGTVDVETGKLLPHDKKFRFTYTVQAARLDEVIPAACPAFDQFCQTSLDNDPAKRQLLLECIGYILLDCCLLEKLWEERDAIVTLALQATQQLVRRNFEFTLPDDSRQFLESFALRGNIISAFIDECCILDADARVFNVELYAAFESLSKCNGLKALSRAKFYELLSGFPHVAAKRLRIGSKNLQGHVGIALKEQR